MKHEELIELIKEEIENVLAERTVKSRTPPRKMSKGQIDKRKKVGLAIKKRPAAVKHFKKKYGKDWESYIWAVATNKGLKSKNK